MNRIRILMRSTMLCSALSLMADTPVLASAFFEADSRLPSAAQDSQAILGKGYDKEMERFAGDCVHGDIQYVGGQESNLRFDRSLSDKETSDTLGFSMGAKARYGLFNGSLSAQFAKSSASDSYSESTIYSAHYKFKNAKLAYRGMTDIGTRATGGSHGNYAWDNWSKTCGHEYVEQIELGAKIFISAKIEFSSQEDKSRFAADCQIKGPAFSASAELERASRTFGSSAAVYIQALQLGGDVRQLSRIFGTGPNATIADGDHNTHALIVCSMSRIDACKRVLDNALRYATDLDDPNSFPNQIRPELQPSDPGWPAELTYITKPWSDLAIYSPPALISSLVSDARSSVAISYEQNLQFKRRVESILTGPFRLTPGQRQRAEEAQAMINANMQQIYDTAMLCYNQVESCVEAVAALSGRIRAIPAKNLSIEPESFVQWCDAYKGLRLNRSTSHTIRVLLEEAEKDGNLNSDGDYCAAADRMLAQRRELDLSEREVSDLRPISSLAGVESLNLNGNQIRDVSPLNQLQALKYLYLNRNLIRSIEPLANLSEILVIQVSGNLLENLPMFSAPMLLQIRAADNRISSLRDLGNLPMLSRLVLSGNCLVDIEPIMALPVLSHLDVASNHISDFTCLNSCPNIRTLIMEGNPGACPVSLRSKLMFGE